jgi:peptidoglycan hydrolase-like protein with peptidoglycan-binding domain
VNGRRTTGVIAGVASAGAVVAAITLTHLPPAESSSAGSSLPAETASITRTTLIDRESHDGTVGHGDTTAISARAGGTVTMLPAVGATITRGKPLYKIDNRAVVLFYGSLPAYRTLGPGSTGADVKELEKNLWSLGYRGFTVDAKYTSATADAVAEWQDDHGLSETGTVANGQIAYAPGPVRIDSRTADPGAQVQPGAGVLKVTGTALVATVDLDMEDQRLAHAGAAVEITLPDGSVVPGRISTVGTVVVPGDQADQDTTKIEVTIVFSRTPAGLGNASVGVAFTAGRRANVLAVPVAALLALSEGGYGVQLVEGSTTRIAGVQTGLFADGQVEISGTGLQAGQKVGMPS